MSVKSSVSELSAGAPAESLERAQRSLLGEMARKWQLYLLLLPTYVLVLVFAYQPALSALYHSFFWWNGIRQHWVGLENFLQFGKDEYFYKSVWNVIQLTLFQLATHLTIPLLAAVLIYRLRNRVRAYWYQILLVIPMVVPSIVSMLIWRWFFAYEGLINIVLRATGNGESARAWFGEPSLALYALMLVGFPWAGGMPMLVYLAGLQQIPNETIEASIIDGVGSFSRFFHIELPLLLGQVKLLLILTVIAGVQQFTLPLVMTGGGPGWATMVPGLRMYFVLTNEFRYGYASAIGVALFLVMLVLTYLNQRYLRSSVEYDPR